ncbi:hypothetical protein N7474_005934 [Penicillium riverlandense]|uniref:uncharacterized protein n=1 Tax=Penicillium riverlandense TaxID=1903569 RepID=UPI00254816FE|nr:uncharacterized protein N7474_005934 [Penicillium riverlandense]KAJ5820343.1 hypothetical protein N7474_005934 [Penicillium riverlandense]
MHITYLLALAPSAIATVATTKKRDVSNPKVKTAQVVGLLSDSTLNRDSCGSAKFGDRALWVCRDSQHYGSNGVPDLPLFTSSASWTDIIPGGGTNLTMYGNNDDMSFYPLVPGNCNSNQAGTCANGTRYPLWANSPPLVTSSESNGTTIGYTWIDNNHISGLTNLIADPSTTLYRVSYTSGDSSLPQAEIVNSAFWAENEIPYGNYGGVVQNDTAYIWGQASNGDVALARVPAGSVEDKSQYEFYVSGGWTTEQPALGDDSATIANVSAGGQGTYYYSESWQSYVWIGQQSESVSADFYITTAPAPEGPWIEPVHFYSGVNGNYSLSAYTLQANPVLSPADENIIYLTYTKTDSVGDNVALYTTPLILVEWED